MQINDVLNASYWQNFAFDCDKQSFIDSLKQIYKLYQKSATLDFKQSDRLIYEKTGSRSEFEKPYFERRHFTVAAAILALIYPDEEQYLISLQKVLIATCNEFSWAVPAHCSKNCLQGFPETCCVDLFAAETGAMLAEIYAFLQERLSPQVKNLLIKEIETRILTPFARNKHYIWEDYFNNWLAVCAGNVAIAAIWTNPAFFQTHKQRLVKLLKDYLLTVPDDGTCLEGVGYWHYGYGEFIWTADLLYAYTQGEIDLFTDPKVKKLALYPERSFLCGNVAISYADGNEQDKTDLALLCYLSEKFAGDVHVLPAKNTCFWKGNVSWLQSTRSLWYSKAQTIESRPIKNYYLPLSEQAIINQPNYSLFVKAGNNNEPHNHNDVGSFILANKNGQVLCDLGATRYTKEYFLDDKRYQFLSCSSRGHSVPIINGCYQKTGKRYRGSISLNGNQICVDFANAYEISGLNRLTRTFTYQQDDFTLTDSWDLPFESFTERFITKKQPIILRNGVCVDGVNISFDATLCSVAIQRESIESHAKPQNPSGKKLNADGFELIDVYLIDFTLKRQTNSITFHFQITEKA